MGFALVLVTCDSLPVYQALSLAEQERSALQEKLSNLNHELAEANVEYERFKRDAVAKQEQDRGTINNLQAEFRGFREQFDEAT